MRINVLIKSKGAVVKMADSTDNPHEGHRYRMKQQFIENGYNFDNFRTHQILELFLFYACPRKDTNELAHSLMNRFGTLSGVFSASAEELMSVNGISEHTAIMLKSIPQLMKLYSRESMKSDSFDSPDKLIHLFEHSFDGTSDEEFHAACFDNQLRMISMTVISSGTPSSSAVNMRRLSEFILKNNSTMAAIAHNHPKGTSAPSKADISTTRIISGFLKSIGTTLLDHIIVGDDGVFSMRKSGTIGIFD